MPRAIPVAVRQLIWQRHQQGESTTALAAAYGVSARAIRALIGRLHSAGPDAIRPNYHAPPPPPHAKPADCRAEVLQLRRDHATWGAAWMLTILRQRFPDRPWPAPRTAQRWLKAAGLNPAPRGRRPGTNASRAAAPHEVWQMDGAECIRLANGEQVCWLRIVDELTGAALQTTIFPPAPAVSGRRATRPRGLAPGLHALGRADPVSRGQRDTVGVG
jgi:transposase